MQKIKVLIVEDHAVVREGLKALVRAGSDMRVVGEAEDGEIAVKMARKIQPDVILMDVAMPRMNGLEATEKIMRALPRTKVLVLSTYSDNDLVKQLLAAGAIGYMTKHSASDDLLEAIRAVSIGNASFSPVIARALKNQEQHQFLDGRLMNKNRELTVRERQVLKLLAEGLSNKQMGAQLHLSAKTVEKHRQQLMRKLGIHEVAGLTRYAISKGIISLEHEAAA